MTVVPKPNSIKLAMLAVPSFQNCVDILSLARRILGETLSSFEFIDSECMRCVTENLGYDNPLHGNHECFLLIETSGSNSDHDESKMSTFLESCLSQSLATDGVQAANERQASNLWALREGGAEALKADGHTYKQDISLPLHAFGEVANAARERLRGTNYTRVVTYGHMADGNAHLNITSERHEPEIDRLLYPWLYKYVSSYNGSISAEHGIGLAKAKYMHLAHSQPAVLNLMRKMKGLFDPSGILNPYKVLV